MTKRETIDALAAAVAGLLAERGDSCVRLGDDGYIVGVEDGEVHIDGEPVASVSAATICEI